MKDINHNFISLYLDINTHLLDDSRPSEYMNTLLPDIRFQKWPFTLLGELKETRQSPVYHPEGDVWNHTMLVVDQAAAVRERSSNQKAFMWAALLHDIGKPETTKVRKGRITSYDHDKVGEGLAVKFLEEFIDDSALIYKISKLVRYHMHILYVIKNLPYADMDNMLLEVDINELALLGYCDRMGRTGSVSGTEKEAVNHFIKKCNLFYNRTEVSKAPRDKEILIKGR